MKDTVKPLGALIDELNKIREAKRVLEEKVKEQEDAYKELEERLMARLEAEGTDKATGKTATASVSTSVSFSIKDDTKFFAWMSRTKNYHLMQRRISDPAAREVMEMKRSEIPGLEAFSKKRLNLRALKPSVKP